ncbi:S-adenosyl-L-methionine-dependent methyltransferase [Piptocephalis cylindrospora]|uniref:S-adenosyl-L-methionine-dependent methyltransferase n=1 Tax=Piptocephalis cylindrospora TaxID=1907219 RepID=A0A4P9Y5A8_9FUNG|nr:S-adenosyl-L-methionine-dependent methyltransferase [Piptocephalis cylindrospora]|eukprot:RKP14157.1 S-adenosyl-L-methionine-dependent methyltransferase [Piptocephalis cylindrospora]
MTTPNPTPVTIPSTRSDRSSLHPEGSSVEEDASSFLGWMSNEDDTSFQSSLSDDTCMPRSIIQEGIPEIDRLNEQHYMIKHVLGGQIHLSPMPLPPSGPRSILDVGCGSGIWLMEAGDLYKNAQCTGIDQTTEFIPSSIASGRFHIVEADVQEGLPFPDDSFDFLFHRFLYVGAPNLDWDEYFSEAFRVCQPGATIEVVETSGLTCRQGPNTQRIQSIIETSVLLDARKSRRVVSQIGKCMNRAGFQDINRHIISIPLGSWGGRVGKTALRSVMDILERAKPVILAQNASLSEEDLETLFNEYTVEVDQYRSFWNISIYVANKPRD